MLSPWEKLFTCIFFIVHFFFQATQHTHPQKLIDWLMSPVFYLKILFESLFILNRLIKSCIIKAFDSALRVPEVSAWFYALYVSLCCLIWSFCLILCSLCLTLLPDLKFLLDFILSMSHSVARFGPLFQFSLFSKLHSAQDQRETAVQASAEHLGPRVPRQAHRLPVQDNSS